MRLLKGTNQLCRVALDMGGGVRACDITDQYIVVLLTDGTVAQLSLDHTHEDTPTLALGWPDLAKGAKVTLISTYTDASGLFVTELKGVESVGVVGLEDERRMSVDDEEELLYGDVEALTAKVSKRQAEQQQRQEATSTPTTIEATPTRSDWCVVYREDGSLEIYQIPEFRVVFSVRNFSTCPKTLQDSGPLSSE